ncbi:MAG: hypothetical protein JKY51_11135, partial [Opitutaceae bacterium]|nr:hypothetical protein [Opitutaceae bacterium]
MLMEESPAVSKHAIVVFGVCGCGKSTVGKLLAVQLQSPFLEGDEFHPSKSIQKMTAISPLSDEDRAPWLARLGQELGASARKNGNAVAAFQHSDGHARGLLLLKVNQQLQEGLGHQLAVIGGLADVVAESQVERRLLIIQPRRQHTGG